MGWYAGFGSCAVLSFYLSNLSLAHLPLGTALLGMLMFGDPWAGPRLFFLATLIGSVLGLKTVSH